MINLLKHFFGEDPQQTSAEHDLRVATCALFVELANIDGEFSAEETAQILDNLKDHYGLSDAHAQALLDEAHRESSESVDFWKFTNQINVHASTEEKLQIVEMLWRIVYADGRMDDHEHYLMSRMVNLLNLEHRQVFSLKSRVKAEISKQ